MSLELPPTDSFVWRILMCGLDREELASAIKRELQAYARQAQRMALEEAAQFIERAQVRMKLPGNQAFCIYDANMAEEIRKLAEGL